MAKRYWKRPKFTLEVVLKETEKLFLFFLTSFNFEG